MTTTTKLSVIASASYGPRNLSSDYDPPTVARARQILVLSFKISYRYKDALIQPSYSVCSKYEPNKTSSGRAEAFLLL